MVNLAFLIITSSALAVSFTIKQAPAAAQIPMKQSDNPPALHAPYFQMAAEQRALLVSKVQQINIGATRDSVKTMLGQPDVDDLTTRKERPGHPTGRRVRYYVVWYEKGSANERFDQDVTFWFDMNDHLLGIESNVAGIPNRPEPPYHRKSTTR